MTAARPASKAAARFTSSLAAARVSSPRAPGPRGAGASAPRTSPFCASRKVPASLASSAASSGSVSGEDTNAAVFLAIRCDSRASWLAYSRSRGLAPACPARWARSTSCLLPCATVAAPFATSINRCWLSSSCSTLVSTRSQRDLMPCRSRCSSSSCTASSATPLIVPPRCRASRSVLNRSRESFTASNATGRPSSASVEPLASRCDSICISVAVATDAAPCAAVRTSIDMMSAAKTTKVTSRMPRTWNCRAIGRWPISGTLRGTLVSVIAERICSISEAEACGS